MITRPTLYEMVEERYPGNLAEQLESWRKAKVSVPAMARMISSTTGVAISGQTVRRWLGIA